MRHYSIKATIINRPLMKLSLASLLACLTGLFTANLTAEPAPASQTPPLKVQQVRENIYMIQGRGGNLGVSVGEDGIFLIDDQYAPASPDIIAELKKLNPGKMGFVINTHWHGDHTGGNENMAKQGATIVAHDNVRKRMSSEQTIELFKRAVPASPEAALPVITFSENLSFHLNNDELAVMHMPHAHTDGDAIVYFKQANIIHMGDIYFNGIFPFIDTSSGGSIEGVISAVNQALMLANADTKIIPGHGGLSNPEELAAYRDMLVAAKLSVAKLFNEGKSLEQIQAAKPLADIGQKWGKGFIKTDVFINIIFDSLKR